MQIIINGHQFEITDALRQFINDKFEKIQRHFDRIKSINVTLKIEKLLHIAEATIHVPGSDLHATAESTHDMYSAIDQLSDKLDRQVKKHKETEK